MQPPLKNANGYRSPYINALNAAATANEIVAGDLTVRRTPQGTTLRIPQRPRLRRFRLAVGTLSGATVAILSEGNLILATGRAALLPGKDVSWSDAASPNPGWTSSAIPASPGHWLDAILAQHVPTGDVYVVFQSGADDTPDTPLHQLLPANLGTLAETDVAAIVTIGRIHIPASTSSNPSTALQITQYIADDIPALGLSTPTPFNHRFKVTAETVTDDSGNTSITLHIRPGSVWKRDGDALAPIGLSPVAPLVSDGDGWKVDNAVSGSIYIIQVGDDYQIKHSNPESETGTILLRIADVTITTSDPPTVSIVQRQIGDFVLAAPGQEETPVAWKVALRKKEVSSGTIDQWQIFAPTWTVGRETLLPEGMAEDWNDLDTTSGDLYAALTWTGTATTGLPGVQTTWTPGKPILTNDLSSIPADDDPTPDNPSTSTIEGKEGHRSIIVKIGTFLADENNPPPEGEDTDPVAFLQIHTGSIIEDISLATPAPADEEPIDNPASWEVRAFDEVQEDGTTKKVWKIWSPLIQLGHQILLPRNCAYGWNALDEVMQTNEGPCLYLRITLLGPSSREDDKSIGITRWSLHEAYVFRQSPGMSSLTYPTGINQTGRRDNAVYIGRFNDDNTEFSQWHTGLIIKLFQNSITERYHSPEFFQEELLHESALLPTAFAITDEGKLEITTRNIRVPQAAEDNEEKLLLDLPAGGGTSDVLGPIEWDSSRNSYVQYLGKWTYNGSSWTFAKKMNGSTAYPPAAVYPVTAANLLVRANQYGNPDATGSNIAVVPFNLPFASAAATTWLSKRESTVSNGVVYTQPETVDGQGSLDSATFTLTYWTDTGETNRQNTNLLGSIVEAANESSTYEG